MNYLAQDNSNCYQKEAFCGLINDITKQESVDSCANYCTSQSAFSCKYFTFDPATKLCETFTSSTESIHCNNVFCPDCTSGTRLKFCGDQGFCKVVLIKKTKKKCCASHFLGFPILCTMSKKLSPSNEFDYSKNS